MTRRRRSMWIAAGLIAAFAIVPVGLAVLSRRRPELGLVGGRLRPCPASPNCVCSCDTDDQHGIAPLDAGTDPPATMKHLRAILASTPRVRIVTDDASYLHAEFTSALFRFVDDVEFFLDEDAGVIHVRSGSRVGYSDLGANRRRIVLIREELAVAANRDLREQAR